MNWLRQATRRGTGLIIGMLVVGSASAAQWQTNAGVAVGGTYSDNICLSQSDTEGKWVATATPDVRLTGSGARANMDLLAALEFNSLSNNSPDCPAGGIGGGLTNLGNKESPAPRLRFSADAILIDDWLFIDAGAFADQNKVNPFGVGGGDNLNGTGNTNTIYSYNISPYVSKRLGDSADFLLRYTYNEQKNTESLLNDSKSQSAIMDVGTDPRSSKISVGLQGEYSEVEFNGQSSGATANNTLSSARLRSSFQINSQWQLNGYIGEEWNDFVSVFQDGEGTFWDVGFLWTPNSRVSVAAGTGDRFFGSTPRFDVSYRHKRSSVRASYARTITYSRDLRGRDQFANDIDGLVDQTAPTSGSQTFAGAPTGFTNAPILDERFTLVYSFSGRSTSIALNASHSEQTRAEDGFKDTFVSAGVSMSRSLSRRLSFNSNLTWEDRQGDENRDGVGGVFGRNSDTWRFLAGLQSSISSNTRVTLNYQYSQRNSDFSVDEYEENRLIFSIRYQF